MKTTAQRVEIHVAPGMLARSTDILTGGGRIYVYNLTCLLLRRVGARWHDETEDGQPDHCPTRAGTLCSCDVEGA